MSMLAKILGLGAKREIGAMEFRMFEARMQRANRLMLREQKRERQKRMDKRSRRVNPMCPLGRDQADG